MRLPALALSIAFAASASAQVTPSGPTHEEVLNNALQNLHLQRDVTVSLNGMEQVGDRLVPIEVVAVWHHTGDGAERTYKLALQRRSNGVLTQEVRATGEAVYAYDFINRTYSATRYHQMVDSAQPNLRDAKYLPKLLAAFGRAATSGGPDSYISRLFQDAMGAPAAIVNGIPLHYRRWVPGRAPVSLDDRPDLLKESDPQRLVYEVYRDPLLPFPARQYRVEPASGNPERNRWFYLYDSAPRQSLVFEITDGDRDLTTPYDTSLAAIHFGSYSRTGTKDRWIAWSMTITTPAVNPADASYETQFAPYTDMRGWRPVAAKS